MSTVSKNQPNTWKAELNKKLQKFSILIFQESSATSSQIIF